MWDPTLPFLQRSSYVFQTSLWAASAVQSIWQTSPSWECCAWMPMRSLPKTFLLKLPTVCGMLPSLIFSTHWSTSLICLNSSRVWLRLCRSRPGHFIYSFFTANPIKRIFDWKLLLLQLHYKSMEIPLLYNLLSK